MSKFVGEGETHTDPTPYVFPKDYELEDKLPTWGQVYLIMLIDIACKTDGMVKDCDEVVKSSLKYRYSQDCFGGFINEKIERCEDGYVTKKILSDAFKEWFIMNNGNRRLPKLGELTDIFTKRFGNPNSERRWTGIRIKYDDDQEDDIAELKNSG